MRSPKQARHRTLRWFLHFALTLSLTTAAHAVPPTEKGKGDGHPAGDAKKKPEKIAPASNEGNNAIEGFRKPEGWQASLFAAEPNLANPVAFTVDNTGRVFVCESFRQDTGVTDNRKHDKEWLLADLSAMSVQDRIDFHRRLMKEKAAEFTAHDDRIRMLVDTNGDGKADESTVFAEGFNNLEDGTGAGVLVHEGVVYFTCIPKLWWLEDKDNDGKADVRKAMADGFGVRVAFRGHDMHGLVIGPDGRLYFSIGDRGYNVDTQNGKLFDPESGAVFRCELDGSNLEVFATGLRNPQELAFDDHGNLFTGDNNSDSGDKARWVNVLEGGDTGWRMMYQYISDRGPFNREKIWHPFSAETPAYIVPPIQNIGDGPSGLTYYPGTGLSEEYQDCFLMVDFRGGPSNSGIRLIKVKPKGAFWEVERNEQLIWNMLATDAEFGPDGALWVTDWVDGWVGEGKGRVYRFFEPESQKQAVVAETQQLLKDGFKQHSGARLATLLSHQDRRVRSGAQWELATRGAVDELAKAVAESGASPIARLHAVWGLGHIARIHSQNKTACGALLAELLSDADPEIRGAAAHVLADASINTANKKIASMLTDSEPRVRYQAAVACGKLKIAEAFNGLVTLLTDNADSDPALRHAGIMGLTGQPQAEALIQLSRHSSRSVRLAAVVALRKRQDVGIASFLNDDDIAVRVEAARAINDVTALHAALPQLAAAVTQVGIPEPMLHRALNANFRLGKPEGAAAIAKVAADSERSEAMRREALEMLAAWSKPGELDRVMNRFLPLPDRDAEPARKALADHLVGTLDAPTSLRSFALETAAKLGVTQAAEILKTTLQNTQAADSVKAQALRSLAKLDLEAARPFIEALVSGGAPELRIAAVSELAKIDVNKALPLLKKAAQSEISAERQNAWDVLAKCNTAEASALVKTGVQDYIAGKLPTDVWMNVIEAAEGQGDKELLAALKKFDEAATTKDPLEAYRDCLSGGDAGAGSKLFFTRAELSCVRCHKVGDKGGEVGPVLTQIAKTKDARYLLEAIVNPDAKIAENFETVQILTEDEELFTGIVKQETAEAVVLMTPEGKSITVPKNTIATRKKGKSSMPSDLTKFMTRRQLRDLVAYLNTLK
ncbi:MAG: PVC-type heme-binding CxxCH protein [Pirellulales bacterium]